MTGPVKESCGVNSDDDDDMLTANNVAVPDDHVNAGGEESKSVKCSVFLMINRVTMHRVEVF